MSIIKIYGIRNCDTVKKALKYLINKDIPHQYIDLRIDSISEYEFTTMLDVIGLEVLINKRSTTFRSLTEYEKNNINYELVLKFPTLIKRPVLVQDKRIMVGFNEKKYANFLVN